MNTQKSNKRTIFLFSILILSGIAWFLTRPTEVIENETVADNQTSAVESANAIALLQKTQSINFNFNFLDTPEFLQLIDRSTPLINLPIGRENPFAPNK